MRNSEVLNNRLYLHAPMIIFASIWLLVYVMYFVQPYKMDRIHGYTWALLLTSNMTVILGYYISYNYHGLADIYRSIGKRGYIEVNVKCLSVLIITLFTLSLISTIIWVYLRASEAGGVIEYFSNPSVARFISVKMGKLSRVEWKYYESILAVFRNLNLVNAILGALLFTSKKRRAYIALLPNLYGLIKSISGFERRSFLIAVFLWLIGIFYICYYLPADRRREIMRSLFKIIFLVVVILISYFLFIIVFRSAKGAHIYMSPEKVLNFIGKNIYSYLVGNIVLLNWFLHGHVTYYGGVMILSNLFRWFNVIGVYENPKIPYFFYVFDFIKTRYITMNTYTYVRYFYNDFGEAGLIPLSFILGAVTFKLVLMYLRKFSLVRLFLVSIFCYTLLLSFLDFYLKMMMVPLYCSIALYMIDRKFTVFSMRNEEQDD